MRTLTKSLAFASAALLALLGVWEGGKSRDGGSTVYADRLAGGLPTVCNGITKYAYQEKPIIVGDYWTKEDCEKAEHYVITYTQKKLAKCMPYATQEAFDAITSLSHNMGVDRVCKTSRAVRLINEGKIAEGCKAIAWGIDGNPVWSSAEGKFYRGLHNRRLDEMKMCMRGGD